MRSSRPAPRISARFGRRPIALLLGLIALFSMSVLTGWHENHPDVHFDEVSIAAVAGHAGHVGEGGTNDLDHIAAHAGLHGIGLPAAYDVTIAPLVPAVSWAFDAQRFSVAARLFAILRPRGTEAPRSGGNPSVHPQGETS